MAAIADADRTLTRITPNEALVMAMVQTRNTADNGDTLTVTLADIGIDDNGLLWVNGNEHTTDNSVIVTQAPTIAVAAGVLTITLTGANSNNVFTFMICGRSAPNQLT